MFIFLLILALVPGGYTPWGDWEECSVTCGAGSQSRSRSSTDPSPEHGGTTFLEQGLGEATEDQACDAGPCPGNNFLDIKFDMVIFHSIFHVLHLHAK